MFLKENTGVFVLLYSNFIGVFDSGLGGISVLKALTRHLPSETFLYLADKENAPYGTKNDGQILELTRNNAQKLIDLGAKALVLACNTATSVAAKTLRKELMIPIIGLEPAIKPAISYTNNGNILVLATEVTVSHPKFTELLAFLDARRTVALAAPYLVEYVEDGKRDREKAIFFLREILSPYNSIRFDACVLGCTHFPFVKEEIVFALGYAPRFFDGADGAAKQLKRVLSICGKLSNNTAQGEIIWLNKYRDDLHKRLYNSNL